MCKEHKTPQWVCLNWEHLPPKKRAKRRRFDGIFMTEIILGKDFLANKEQITDLIPEFFALIDPDGTNVIQEKKSIKGGYLCHCLFKFIGVIEPFEADFHLSTDMYNKIVLEIDINTLMETH